LKVSRSHTEAWGSTFERSIHRRYNQLRNFKVPKHAISTRWRVEERLPEAHQVDHGTTASHSVSTISTRNKKGHQLQTIFLVKINSTSCIGR
jgi:hypothetical protein